MYVTYKPPGALWKENRIVLNLWYTFGNKKSISIFNYYISLTVAIKAKKIKINITVKITVSICFLNKVVFHGNIKYTIIYVWLIHSLARKYYWNKDIFNFCTNVKKQHFKIYVINIYIKKYIYLYNFSQGTYQSKKILMRKIY